MLPIILNIPDDDDREVVEKIYTKYEKKLYMVSMRYLHNHHDAQDCVHETVRKIIESVDKFKTAQDEKYVERLATVTCRNCALNALRKRNRRDEYEQSLTRYNYNEDDYEDIEIPDYDSFVDKIYIDEQNCDQLHNLINNLDDKYRDVILLKSMGFDFKRIAMEMNISEDLARQRYFRAKKQLWKMGGRDLHAE